MFRPRPCIGTCLVDVVGFNPEIDGGLWWNRGDLPHCNAGDFPAGEPVSATETVLSVICVG